MSSPSFNGKMIIQKFYLNITRENVKILLCLKETEEKEKMK